MGRTVLILTGMRPSKYGSMERYFVEVAKECAKYDYQATFQFETKPTSAYYLENMRSLGARVIVKRLGPSMYAAASGLVSLYLNVRPQIVHIHFLGKYALLLVGLGWRLIGAQRATVTVHSKSYYSKKSPRRFAYNLYSRVLSVSDAVRHDLIQGGVKPDLVQTHYLGLFGERRRSDTYRAEMRNKLGIPDNAIVLGCIAFDAPVKGFDILLDAFHRVTKCNSQVYLLSIGIDPTNSPLVHEANQLGISSRVSWAGIVDRGWELLNAVDVYVQPSRPGEGLPFAIMEAMAMSLPVVATRVSGNIEAVLDGESGMLANAEDPQDLAAVILRMLDDPSNWKRLGEAGQKKFQQTFLGEVSVRKLIREHYQLCGQASI